MVLCETYLWSFRTTLSRWSWRSLDVSRWQTVAVWDNHSTWSRSLSLFTFWPLRHVTTHTHTTEITRCLRRNGTRMTDNLSLIHTAGTNRTDLRYSRPSCTKREVGHAHSPASRHIDLLRTDWLQIQRSRSHSSELVFSSGTVRSSCNVNVPVVLQAL